MIMMRKCVGGGPQQLDLVMRKFGNLSIAVAYTRDQLVSTLAHDDDGDGCDMRVLGSCYYFGNLFLAAGRFVYRFLGVSVCILCGPQGPYVCIYVFMLWLDIMLYNHIPWICVSFMYMRLALVSIYGMICMMFRESVVNMVIFIFLAFIHLSSLMAHFEKNVV